MNRMVLLFIVGILSVLIPVGLLNALLPQSLPAGFNAWGTAVAFILVAASIAACTKKGSYRPLFALSLPIFFLLMCGLALLIDPSPPEIFSGVPLFMLANYVLAFYICYASRSTKSDLG